VIEREEEQATEACEIEALRARVRELENLTKESGKDAKILWSIAEATPAAGAGFFPALAKSLANTLNVRYAFVTECLDQPVTQVRALAFWMGDRFVDNREWTVQETPCENVFLGKNCFHPKNLRRLFPDHPALEAMGAESYCALALRDHTGEAVGHLGILHDQEMALDHSQEPALRIFAARAASEIIRMRSEDATRESLNTLRTIIDGATEVIYLQDLEGVYRLINKAGAASLGRTPDEVVGKSDEDLFGSEAESLRVENETVITTEKPLVGEQTVTLGGSPHVFRTTKSPHRDADGRVVGVIGICRDVTESLAAEEKLRNAERLASVGTLAAGIAHEINNPLSAILFSADTALHVKDTPGHEELLEKSLENISRAAERAGRIVKSVLTFAGQQESPRERADLHAIARRACDLTRHVAETRGINIDLDGGDEMPVRANPLEIEQAFVNIINNAIEASNDDGTIAVELEKNAQSARVRVRDYGCGLTEEQKSRIFDPFYTTRPGMGGTGLGLSITHGIITLHGGSIEIVSEDGGTAVIVELPLEEAAPC